MATTQGPAPTGGGAQKTPLANKAMFSFYPITSETKPKFLNILIYGAPGMGKTTLAASAVDAYPEGDVLVVSAEGGDIVFENNDRVTKPDHIDMMRAGNIQQVQKVYEWLQQHLILRKAGEEDKLRKLQNLAFFGMAEPPADQIPDHLKRVRKYHTVILDSLTDIEAMNMNHILGITEDQGFIAGDDLTPPGYTEFRKNNNTIQQLVRAFRNLEMNLIVICGQRWQKDEMQKFHYGPAITGQLADQVQSFVDIVGWMVKGQDPNDTTKEMHKLYVQPMSSPRFDAKCRIASYKKPSFNDPVFKDILRECGYLPKSASAEAA